MKNYEMDKVCCNSSNSTFVRLFHKRLTIIQFILIVNLGYAQSSIVASGTNTYTIGETFPIMQQLDTVVEVSLSVPKYETEHPKSIIKKKLTWWQRLLKAIFG